LIIQRDPAGLPGASMFSRWIDSTEILDTRLQ
jgi:hypothetical protein